MMSMPRAGSALVPARGGGRARRGVRGHPAALQPATRGLGLVGRAILDEGVAARVAGEVDVWAVFAGVFGYGSHGGKASEVGCGVMESCRRFRSSRGYEVDASLCSLVMGEIEAWGEVCWCGEGLCALLV